MSSPVEYSKVVGWAIRSRDAAVDLVEIWKPSDIEIPLVSFANYRASHSLAIAASILLRSYLDVPSQLRGAATQAIATEFVPLEPRGAETFVEREKVEKLLVEKSLLRLGKLDPR